MSEAMVPHGADLNMPLGTNAPAEQPGPTACASPEDRGLVERLLSTVNSEQAVERCPTRAEPCDHTVPRSNCGHPRHTKPWYLERIPLIAALSESQKSTLRSRSRIFSANRGQRIYRPADPSEEVFLLSAGVVKLVATSPDRRVLILAFRSPGDIFGELSLLDPAPRDHVAEVHEDAVICAVDRAVFLAIMNESPALRCRVVQLLLSLVRSHERRLKQLFSRSAGVRLAQTLLELGAQCGIHDAAGTLVPFRVSQQDLASLAGLSRETVNVVLRDLKQRDLVEVRRCHLRIRDAEALRAVVGPRVDAATIAPVGEP